MTFFYRPILSCWKSSPSAVSRLRGDLGRPCLGRWKRSQHRESRPPWQNNNLESIVHCPIMDISIASPNKGIREESIRQTLLAIDLARDSVPGSSSFTQAAVLPLELIKPLGLQVEAISRILAVRQGLGSSGRVENMDSDKRSYPSRTGMI